MSNVNENEYNAVIDALRNMTDVVLVLTTKLCMQEDEIIKLKKTNLVLEENINKINDKLQNFKIKTKVFSNTSLNTDEEKELSEEKSLSEEKELNENTDNETNEVIITEPTTIGETDIEKARKSKAIQLVDRLIQKKKEITHLINDDKDEKITMNTVPQENNKIMRRKNKVMRRF